MRILFLPIDSSRDALFADQERQQALNTAPLIAYLRRPFARSGGFSAYRFPGLIVHLPIALCFLVPGASLTLWQPWLWPLFPVYLVAGIYVGRDVAILAHYNPLITLAVLGAFIGLIVSPDTLRFLLSGSRNPLLSLAITPSVAAGFCAWVGWRISAEQDQAEPAGQPPAAPREPRLFASGGLWLLSIAWFAVVFATVYRPEHPRAHGLAWAPWLLPLIAAAALALAFRSNAQALRNRGPRPAIVLGLKWALLLVVLAVPPAVFVTGYADFRLRARVARMIDSVAPVRARVLAERLQARPPAGAGEAVAWPAELEAGAGLIGSDGTILIFDTATGALAIIAPEAQTKMRCLGFPRALAPRACRDYPAPTSLEDGSGTNLSQTVARLSKVADGIKVASATPSSGAARFLPRDGELDFGYLDPQGQVALYNDRHGILMLLRREDTGRWRCRLLAQGRPEAACPAG
jgi:hypothetical protein